MSVSSCLLLLYLIAEVLSASCLLNTSDPSVAQQASRGSFAGIDWTESERTCSSEQLAILEEATSVVVHEMLYSAIDVPIEGNQNWNRFFMNNIEASPGQGWTDNKNVSTVIRLL
jgi:hypothetical protein